MRIRKNKKQGFTPKKIRGSRRQRKLWNLRNLRRGKPLTEEEIEERYKVFISSIFRKPSLVDITPVNDKSNGCIAYLDYKYQAVLVI